MASGSTRQGSGSKGFDFASDDILCSYDDLNNQDSSANGGHSDSAVGVGSRKDFHKSRMVPASVFPSTAYGSQEESANEEIISVVERTMKKYADNLMRFLEGISSRLSQLELYCYNLDKSIGEMRSDLVRDHGEDDTKLKSLEKHLQEVHRSVQILRDKQELADTQKELAKLQLVQKECSNNHSQSSEDRTSSPISRPTKPETASDFHNQQLALTGPHHVPPQPSLPTRHAEQQQLTVGLAPPSQPQPYYLPPNQVGPSQTPQGHYLPPDAPQYQHQWPQQLPQMRPQPASVYPSYAPTPPSNPPPDTVPAQMPFSAVPQPSRSEATPYGYGGSVRTSKGSYGPHPGDGYAPAGSQQAISGGNAYMVYDGERGRAHHPPPSYVQGSYPPASVPPLNPTVRNPILRDPINSDLVEKLMGMGFRGDHVASVINRMEESGQPVDFNSVLDRLNGHSSGGSQRGW